MRKRSKGQRWATKSVIGVFACSLSLSVFLVGPIGGQARAPSDDLPRVRLGHGAISSFHWSVYAEPEPSRTPQRPCLTTDYSGGPSDAAGGATICGPVHPIPSLIGDSTGRGRAERTVLAMAFSPSVRSVRLWIAHRAARRIWLHSLSQRQATKVGLIRFRFASRAFAAPFCLQRFAAYGVKGELLDLSQHMGCSRHGRIFNASRKRK